MNVSFTPLSDQGRLAQLARRLTTNQEIAGSSPAIPRAEIHVIVLQPRPDRLVQVPVHVIRITLSLGSSGQAPANNGSARISSNFGSRQHIDTPFLGKESSKDKMVSEQDITVTYKDRIAIITLNQPKKLNALSGDHYYLLGERLREVDKRDDITITVITGTGRFFSAGADVTSARPGAGLGTNVRRELVRNFVVNNIDITHTFSHHSKILVAALNGPAVGLSAALVALADFVYAAPHTFILTPFSSLGLVAEGGASTAFVERLGIAKANEALIQSKRITCEELVSAGFVNKVISAPSGKPEDSDGFLKKVLEEVEDRMGAHLSQSSLLRIKELIRRPGRELMDRQNTIEAFQGLERFLAGIPQEEFRKLATGEKRHKL
ncbi:ClpP/crotonase-like domain-containing protein [Aspergillus nidulans var. acristatus]